MSFRLPCICNLKSISVLSGCLSMPDATSLHHQQYCIILSWIRAFNIKSTLQKRGCKVYVISFLYSKCSNFQAAWVCCQSYASISHNPTKSVHNIYAGPLQLKEFNFSYLFLRQWCRDVASGIDRHPDRTVINFRLQIQGNRKLIPCSRTF